MCNDADPRGELLPAQRYILIVWWLAHGEAFSTLQIAEMFHISKPQAWRMLCLISTKVPIYYNGGMWQVCAMKETQE